MLGLCAPDAASGIAALKAWTSALGLPRRLLHGLDAAGVPVPMEGCARACVYGNTADVFRVHFVCICSVF
jgi:hypothetical protein